MSNVEQSIIPEGWGRIYAMADPRNPRLPVYVGRTTSTLQTRLWDHYGEAKKEKNKARPIAVWVREVRALGLNPVLYTLETAPIESLQSRENYWIVFFRPLGTLLNVHDGIGELGTGPRLSEKQKAITAPFLKAANEKRKKRVLNDLGVVYESLSDAAESAGVSERKMKENISKGWSVSGRTWRFIKNDKADFEPYEL